MPVKLLYVLTGADRWSRQDHLKQLVAQALDPEWQDLNLERFDGEQTESSAVVDSWLTAPFWGDRRVTVVEFSSTGEKWSQLLADLAMLVQKPDFAPPNVLILVSESLDKRKKEVKQLLTFAEHRDFQPVKSWNAEKELAPWLDEQVRKVGKRMSREAIQYLITAIGVDKQALTSALDKLLLYVGDEGLIDEPITRRLVQPTEADVFTLMEHLARRDQGAALLQLQNLLHREPAQKILATLCTLMRNISRAKTLQEQRWDPARIAEQLGQNAFALKKNLDQWRSYSARQLDQSLRRLLNLDATSKRTRLTPQLALEIWICELVTATA
jgi:DNA polymerase-3 subunit delta